MTATDEPSESTAPPGARLSEDLRGIERRRPFRWGLLIGAVLSVASVLLVVQNGHSTGVQWLWLDVEMPLWLLLVVTLATGMVVGEAARLAWHRSRSRAADRQHTLSSAGRRLRRS